jgi:hypothetical protein
LQACRSIVSRVVSVLSWGEAITWQQAEVMH